jgi:hypothetical protein
VNNASFPVGLNAANLVYESTGGRLGWQICKFRRPEDSKARFRNDFGDPFPYQEALSPYRTYGPGWHTHGLDYENFPWNERKKITPSKSLVSKLISRRRTSYEVISIKEEYSQTMSMQPLTVDTALGLFREALDLRPPNS